MTVPALIAGALLTSYLMGRRSMRRALQTTDGRARAGYRRPRGGYPSNAEPIEELPPATRPMLRAVPDLRDRESTTVPLRAQRTRRAHA